MSLLGNVKSFHTADIFSADLLLKLFERLFPDWCMRGGKKLTIISDKFDTLFEAYLIIFFPV